MTNLPILYQNALLQYWSCPIAQKAWLWCADGYDSTKMKYVSDEYANEVQILVESLTPLIRQGFDGHIIYVTGETMDNLMTFILKRHANWRIGNNIKTWWEN